MRRNIIWAAGLMGLYLLLDWALGRPGFISIHTLCSVLISFSGLLFFSVFLSSLYLYKPLKYAVPFFSVPAALPILHFFYYQLYHEFISANLLQSLLQEPLFLLYTFYSQLLPYTVWILVGLAAWCGVTHWLLYPLFTQNPPAHKPLAFYHRAFRAILVLVLLIGGGFALPASYKVAGCCYGVLAAFIFPFLWFVGTLPSKSMKRATFASFILLLAGTSLYASVWRDHIHRLRLDTGTFLTVIHTISMSFFSETLAQPPETQVEYKLLPRTDIPFNVLVFINDGLRARNLGAYGYTQRYPDRALEEFYNRSHIFQYALSPAHFTTPSIVSMFSSQGPERTLSQVKRSRRLWDFTPDEVFTFYALSSTDKWGGLDKFISSFNMKHLWSFTHSDPMGGFVDMMDDKPVISHAKELIAQHPRFIGVIHTNDSHFPFYQNPTVKPYYKPCQSSVKTHWPQASLNCYDNAIRHMTLLEADLLNTIDLSNTVVVFTADHGQQFNEHNSYFYADLYDENIHVPFIWYIPPAIRAKIPAENWSFFEHNKSNYVSNMDILPTVLHLASFVTKKPLAYDPQEISGRSLFSNLDEKVVVASGCFNGWSCAKRETVFADQNYYVLLKPNKQPALEIYPARDLDQQHPLTPQQIDVEALQNIYQQAPQLHPWGTLLQTLLRSYLPTNAPYMFADGQINS